MLRRRSSPRVPPPARRAHPGARRRDGHDDPGATSSARRTTAASASATRRATCKGNNDLLTLTQPRSIARDPPRATSRPARTSSRPTPSTRTRISQADYGIEALVRELNLAAAQLARAAADDVRGTHRPAALRRRRARPHQPHGVALAGRQRPRLPQRHLRRARRPPTREATRALVDGGADLILVETIFDTLNAKAALFAIEARARRAGRSTCR